ncbi:MAG: flagellin [Opitutales bacterium]|nr:flagellin [Opitutales bacterium]
MSDFSLSSGIRSNLLALQKNSKLFDRVNERLASGKKVNSPVDNPTSYFADVNLKDRAMGLRARLDSMGQSIQRIQAADTGISRVRTVITQMKGVVNDALGQTNPDLRASLGKQFNSLIVQMSELVKDSGYAGVNLVSGNERDSVQFSESFDDSSLDVLGFNIQRNGSAPAREFRLDSNGFLKAASPSEGAVSSDGNFDVYDLADGTNYAIYISSPYSGIQSAAAGIRSFGAVDPGGPATAYGAQGESIGGHNIDWAADDFQVHLRSLVADLEKFDDVLKAQASAMANSLAVITNRENFTADLVNVLETGGDRLVLADLNEEAANLLALQTANQLGTQSLSLANQQSQSILQLLG